jgi:hypothetical protein
MLSIPPQTSFVPVLFHPTARTGFRWEIISFTRTDVSKYFTIEAVRSVEELDDKSVDRGTEEI